MFRRLDRVQQALWFRIAASAVVMLACGSLFGWLIARSVSVHSQRLALVEALTGRSLGAGDEHALELKSRGTVTLNGRVYGSPDLAARSELIFDERGVIASPEETAEMLLAGEAPRWVPAFMLEQPGTAWMLAVLTLGWLLLIVWMRLSVQLVLTVLGTAVPAGVFGLAGSGAGMLACAGIGLLSFTFILLGRLALVVLSPRRQALAVGHTVVREASRTRLGLVFIIFLLVTLPLLPLGLDPEAPLRFRMQTFISRSLDLTYGVAALLTLFLSCATVAFEIRDRQIWQLMTKPLTHWSYLAGKWIGVMTVNLIILIVSGVSIFTFIQHLRGQPVAAGLEGALDRQAVRDQVLSARVGMLPEYVHLSDEEVRLHVDQIIAGDPQMTMEGGPTAAARRKLANQVRESYLTGQRTVPPGMARDFRFTGLGRARDLQATMTLRYRFHILRSDEHEQFPVVFWLNNDQRTARARQYVPTMSQVMSIPTSYIQPDGSLIVSVANSYQPGPDQRGLGAINWEMGDFELLSKVSTFEWNFLRAMVMLWIKLGFLAMLGIAAATLLSFPVACLLAFTVFMAGTLGPYLALSLEYYEPPDPAAAGWSDIGLVLQWAFESVIRAVGHVLVFMLGAFGGYQPGARLVEGKLIPWADVVSAILRLGVLWSGLALMFGYIVLRRRQLATYSGHG
jgi:hypothetical protein